jgi:hypothetical protein
MRISCTGKPICVQGFTSPSAARSPLPLFGVPAQRAGHDLVRLPRHAVEVEQELEGRRKSAVPVASQAGALIQGVDPEAPPVPRAHPVDPALPVGLPLAVAVDQPEIDEHLPGLRHRRRQMAEDAAHQRIPVQNAAVGAFPLVPTGRERE